jgi:pimeloyl-ACP methyl ester carboxylesterase
VKTNPLFKRMSRIMMWLIIGILVLATTGAIYQAVSTNSDQRNYPASGQLIDVGGYNLHIYCMGEGSPTVVLDAAADMMSSDWAWIQPEIARQTRVCSYDRAGMGWSDSAPHAQPRDAKQVSSELHTLLTNAGISEPYIMVGHSVAGLYARMYAAEYPEEVVGMVLVDPGHPDMNTRIPALQEQSDSDASLVNTMRVLSYVGLPRLLGVGKNNAQGLPPQQVAEINAFVSRPQHWATILNLINSTSATYDEVKTTGSLGNMPLVVISANTAWFTRGAPADDARKNLNDLQGEIAELSTNSSHRIIEGATHGSLVHNRDDAQAVISAIEDVLTSLKTVQPLTK